jgi:hypothetical protein
MDQQELFKQATKLYILVEQLKTILGGPFSLSDPTLSEKCPKQGVYFLFEPTEFLRTNPPLNRIVHIGTQGTTVHTQKTLWSKISQHRGMLETGAGNHRMSSVRMHIGMALIKKNGYSVPTWIDRDKSIALEVREAESFLEKEVSAYIQNMSVIWLPLEDTPNRPLTTERIFMETNFLSLLCNYDFIDYHPPSEDWLGIHCLKNRVAGTGVWSPVYAEILFIPETLNLFDIYVRRMMIESGLFH